MLAGWPRTIMSTAENSKADLRWSWNPSRPSSGVRECIAHLVVQRFWTSLAPRSSSTRIMWVSHRSVYSLSLSFAWVAAASSSLLFQKRQCGCFRRASMLEGGFQLTRNDWRWRESRWTRDESEPRSTSEKSRRAARLSSKANLL